MCPVSVPLTRYEPQKRLFSEKSPIIFKSRQKCRFTEDKAEKRGSKYPKNTPKLPQLSTCGQKCAKVVYNEFEMTKRKILEASQKHSKLHRAKRFDRSDELTCPHRLGPPIWLLARLHGHKGRCTDWERSPMYGHKGQSRSALLTYRIRFKGSHEWPGNRITRQTVGYSGASKFTVLDPQCRQRPAQAGSTDKVFQTKN